MARSFLIDRCPHCERTIRHRSTEKNAHLHAVLSQISEQKLWAGELRDVETWKRLMVAAFEREKGHRVEMYPALDGQGIDIVYRRTSRMSEEEIRELIFFAESWAVDNGVTLSELKERA